MQISTKLQVYFAPRQFKCKGDKCQAISAGLGAIMCVSSSLSTWLRKPRLGTDAGGSPVKILENFGKLVQKRVDSQPRAAPPEINFAVDYD